MRSALHVLVQALPALTTFLHPLDRPSRTSESETYASRSDTNLRMPLSNAD